MAAYSTLTADEKATLEAYLPVLRSAIVKLAQSLNTIQDLNSVYVSNVQAINAKLDAGLIVPDATGLVGAQSLTSTDLTQFMNALQTMLATNNSVSWRTAYVRAGGVANTMQSA